MSTGSDTRLVEVIPGSLYQSGCPVRFEDVAEAGVNAVVALGHSVQPWRKSFERYWWDRVDIRGGENRQAVYAKIPLLDCEGGLDVVACEAAANLAVGLLRDRKRRVLVHCDMGAFRSVHVAALVVADQFGWSGPDAFRFVDEQRFMREPRTSLALTDWKEHIEKVDKAVEYPD